MPIEKINRTVMSPEFKADLDSRATKTELNAAKVDLENQIAAVVSNLVSKPSVANYAAIATTYPNPQEGWTVTVDDTNITYTYDADAAVWNKTSINALPLATSTLDGRMSAADKTKLDGIQAGAQVNKTPAQVFADIKTLDGSGSDLDSDTVDGKHAADFADVNHLHDGRYYTQTQVDVALGGKADKAHSHTLDDISETTTKKIMTDTERTKLSGISTGANKVTASGTNGKVSVDGTDVTVYTHPTGDGNLHVPANGTTNNTKVLKAGSTAGSVAWGQVAMSEVSGAISDTQHGNRSGGSLHSDATTSTSGFMSSADKTKLNSISTGANKVNASGTNGNILIDGSEATIYQHPSTHSADIITDGTTNKAYTATEKTKLAGIENNANNYTHPSGDGNLHVPATGTTNGTKVLKAGSTAGSISWAAVDWSELANKPTAFTPSSHTHAATDVTQDATHRFVTDTEKSTWNGKQAALGFTPENSANKGVANGYAELDANGKIPDNRISSTFVTQSQLGASGYGDMVKAAYDTDNDGKVDAAEVADSVAWTGVTGKPTFATVATSGKASDLTQDASNRFVSDTEKSTWNAKASTSVATTTANGLMSASDKTKLDGIATGAQANQNAFSNVKVGTTTIAADNATDTLELVAGSNITLTPDATNDKITIAVSGGSGSGLDADKLDGLDSSDYVRGDRRSYTSVSGDDGTDGWYTLFTVGDNLNAPILCNLRAYAHTSVSFVASKGYGSSNAMISVLLANASSTNVGYKYCKGLRILTDGSVQLKLNGGATVQIDAQIFGSGGDCTLVTTLTKDTTASPAVSQSIDPLINGAMYVGASQVWHDGRQYVGSSAPSSPATNMIWIDTN
ncbi:hypothetical protein [Paenibacillus sp. MMO-177]|uniref:hypothetical protein n=1 Tax=Paenibacillus sp. MMO-177 TaxID=3081289 RepID=UPI00301A6272